MSSGEGFIAIWSDIAEDEETDYLHWLTREHTAERLGVPGFRKARVFRARNALARWFIMYRLERANVVASDAYLARLNAPSDWSRRVMPRLRNFARGGGRIIGEAGQGHAGLVAPVLCAPSDLELVRPALSSLAALDRVVAVRLCEVDPSATDVRTSEKSMRAEDESFEALVLLEALDEAALRVALDQVRPLLRTSEPAPLIYDQVFSLDAHALVD